MDRYIAWKCPKCKKWQTSYIIGMEDYLSQPAKIKLIQKKVLRCRKCGKTTKLKSKRTWGLNVEAVFFSTPQEAIEYVNMPRRKTSFRDLSFWVKVGVVGGWIVVFLYLGAIVLGTIAGLLGY